MKIEEKNVKTICWYFCTIFDFNEVYFYFQDWKGLKEDDLDDSHGWAIARVSNLVRHQSGALLSFL